MPESPASHWGINLIFLRTPWLVTHLLVFFCMIFNTIVQISSVDVPQRERIKGTRKKRENEICVISSTAWMYYASSIIHSLLSRSLYPHCLHYTSLNAPSFLDRWVQKMCSCMHTLDNIFIALFLRFAHRFNTKYCWQICSFRNSVLFTTS